MESTNDSWNLPDDSSLLGITRGRDAGGEHGSLPAVERGKHTPGRRMAAMHFGSAGSPLGYRARKLAVLGSITDGFDIRCSGRPGTKDEISISTFNYKQRESRR